MTTQRSRFLVPALLLTALLLPTAGPLQASGGTGSSTGGGGGTSGGGTGGGGGEKSLVLRVNPAIGAPGGVVDVVLRTYAPRPIKQGQVVVKVVRKPAPTAVARFGHTRPAGLTLKSLTDPVRPLTLLSVVVFSPANDSSSKAVLTGLPDSQAVQVNFQSPSGSINSADGPLAVFRFQLDPSVAPGDTFDLTLDPVQTNLKDPAGRPITITPKSNTLTVRAPSDPILAQAADAVVQPGTVTPELGVITFEPFPVSAGRFTLTWDPQLADGPPTVKLDPRYGQATFTADASQPGRLVVDFTSPDASFNSVPGTIVAVTLPIAAGAPSGTTSPFTLDPEGTWLLDPQGGRIPLALQNATIKVQ